MSRTAAEVVAQQIQMRLRELHVLTHQIEEARGNSEKTLEQIEIIQDENDAKKGNLSSTELRKLRNIYKKAVENGTVEEKVIRGALDKIHEIRDIRHERRLEARSAGNKETLRRVTLMKMLTVTAETLPLYISKTPMAPAPPLCGVVPAEPDYVAKMGDMVAAHVKNTSEEDNWILAEVISFDESTNKYEVDDVDEEEDKKRYTISRRRVVPLPLMRVNPETDAHVLFPKGAMIMALYPQTTCFYKAVITQPPTTAHEDYEVVFEDTVYETGYSPPMTVPQRYVISINEGKKRSNRNRH